MKQYISAAPADIGFFGAGRIVLAADDFAELVEELFLWFGHTGESTLIGALSWYILITRWARKSFMVAILVPRDCRIAFRVSSGGAGYQIDFNDRSKNGNGMEQ
jgi:hypothetical protein